MESYLFAILVLVITHIFVFTRFREIYPVVFIIHIIYLSVISFIQFGDMIEFGDIGDYLPYFERFTLAYQNSSMLSFIKPHAPIYVISFPGWMYHINGYDSLFPIRIVNTCVSVLIIWPIHGIYKLVFEKNMKIFQVLAVLMWLPFAFRLSGELGRTPVSILSVLLSVYFLLIPDIRWKIIGLFVMAYATALRVPHIVIFIPIFLFPLWRGYNRINLKVRLVLIPVIVILLVSMASTFVFVFYKFSGENRQFSNVEDVSEYSEGRGYGNSAYLTGISLTPSSLPIYIPLHAFYFNYSPMVWDSLGNVKMLASSFFSTISLFLIIYFYFKRNYIKYDKDKLKTLWLCFLITICLFGLVTKNAGSAERWRMPITLLYIGILSHALRRDSFEL